MTAPIDVLAVMDRAERLDRDWGDIDLAEDLRKARAAVAELIEAARLVRQCGNGGARLDRRASDAIRAALARIGAA